MYACGRTHIHTELWVWLAPAARQMYVIDIGELCCSSLHSSVHAAECSVQLEPWSVLMVSRGQFGWTSSIAFRLFPRQQSQPRRVSHSVAAASASLGRSYGARRFCRRPRYHLESSASVDRTTPSHQRAHCARQLNPLLLFRSQTRGQAERQSTTLQ